jgi:hypothetical protein
MPISHREPTTVLTTTMTTVGLPDTFTYTTIELVSCLVVPSACGYGSEGEGVRILSGARRSEALSGTGGGRASAAR